MTALLSPHGRAARRPDAASRAALAAFGAPKALLARLAGEEEDPNVIRLWPENVASLQLMMALQTQWRVVAGMGALLITGLDYGVVRETARMAMIPWTDERFADLRACEDALLPLLNAKRR